MNLPQIARYRIINQQLADTNLRSPAEMVQWFGAVQAQEYAQTKWGLGLRLKNLKDSDIEKDFEEGKIIRTHVLRPTWHFVSAQDILWILKLSSPRVNAVNAYMYRKLELNDSIFKRCNDILVKTLQGGKQLTRGAINKEFQKNKIIASGHRLSYIMMYAELAAIICSGPRLGNQFTYALLEERVKAPKLLSADEALAELTSRYFYSRGPATVKDYSTWSGLTMADCKKGLEATKSKFDREIIEGNEYYFWGNNFSNKYFPHEIYLLPVYDEFIMGYKDRSAISEFISGLKDSPEISYNCMIVFEGQIIGTWKRTLSKKSIEIEFDFFVSLTETFEKALGKAIERIEEFMSLKANFVIRYRSQSLSDLL